MSERPMSPAAPDVPAPAEAPAPRDAASLVLLRDAAGVEVFMLKRHANDSVLADAYVFPGGKVDAADAHEALLARLRLATGRRLEDLPACCGEPQLAAGAAAALLVAALRETFEETGVLFAVPYSPADATAPRADVLVQARALLRERCGFGDLLERLELALDAAEVEPWTRWVTPVVPSLMRKRFDTRFFVGRLPGGQDALHDGLETCDGEWIAPRDALRRYWDGKIVMAAPQIMTLAHISRFADVGAVLAEARRRPPPIVRPEPLDVEGERFLLYPGDPAHSEPRRAMPGPTRMRLREGRFCPPGGFDDWFR